MPTADDITTALRQHLPADLHSALPALAQVLADTLTSASASTNATATGALKDAQAALTARLAADPNLAAALRVLAGQEVNAGSSVISFGEGTQLGDVSIGDVAGRDVVKIHLDVHQTIGTQQVINAQAGASIGSVIGTQANYYNAYAAPMRSPQEQRNRRVMLQKVKAIWITGFLEKSLTDELRIELNLTDRPDVLAIPINALYQERESEPHPLPAGTNIVDVFDQAGGELLILGAPGAGKTTMLLELLRDLLQRAERDEAHLVPVVFPLSTWATAPKPLKDWMVDQLNAIYDVPKKIGQEWVATNEVLPLLDGLDEVASEYRDACVEAINQHRSILGGLTPTAITSRIADYETLKGKLRLKGAVRVEPLSQQQVENYLTRVGEPLRAVRELVEVDQEVLVLLDSPLMLSVVALAFQDISSEALRVEGTIEERRSRLWESYIERIFSRKEKEKTYSRQQTMNWLSWLANMMTIHQQTTFLVEQLQHRILISRAMQRWYALLDRFFGGLFIGIIYVINTMPSIDNLTALMLGAGVWIGISLFGGISSLHVLQQRSLRQVTTDVIRGFTITGLLPAAFIALGFWARYGGLASSEILGMLASLILGIIAMFIFGISGGVLGLIAGKPGIGPRDIFIMERVAWSWNGTLRITMAALSVGALVGFLSCLPIALFSSYLHSWTIDDVGFGILAVLFCALFMAFFIGPIGGIVPRSLSTSSRPNQGITRSIKLSIMFGIAFCFVFMLLFVLLYAFLWLFIVVIEGRSSFISVNTPYLIISFVLIFSIYGAFAFGGYAVQSHYILRWLLYRQGSLPFLDLIPWLNSCVDRLFLRRIGGGYIFIHRMLMEHFAAMTDEDIARLSGEIEAGSRQARKS